MNIDKESDQLQKDELAIYKNELVDIHRKSQETFEQQLSYISAGCLVLSIGYVKDIVKDISKAGCRSLLMIGWVLMISTLLLNLVSHLLAEKFYSKSISEINRSVFNPGESDKRFKKITKINWICVYTLIFGILLIIIFINRNI
jgi:hypothetical protein